MPPALQPTLRSMYHAMLRAYGPQQWWPAQTPFEVILGAYLTQNTSWRAVERSLANLARLNALTPHGLRALSDHDLRAAIRPSGFMTRKAAALRAFLEFLDHEVGAHSDHEVATQSVRESGPVPNDQADSPLARLAALPTPQLRPKLLALPGVGPETADAILLYALGHPVMVVDEYFRRITVRHGLAPERAPYHHLSRLGLAAFHRAPPHTRPAHLNELHALVVAVGKQHCGPTPRCLGCPLARFPAPIPRPGLPPEITPHPSPSPPSPPT